MATAVTHMDMLRWVVELDEPEIHWVNLISERCSWTPETTLSMALGKGLQDFVLITGQVEDDYNPDAGEEVT